MLRPKPSVGDPFVVDPKPKTGWPSHEKRPKTWWKRLLYAQFVQSSSFGSSALQRLSRSSRELWSGFHGSNPRFGSPRCHDWTAQWLPSGIVQPATNHASCGPA